MAGEGRAHEFLVHQRLLLGHLGLGAAQVGGIGVEHGLADGLGFELGLVAVVGDLGKGGVGLERFEMSHIVGRAQLQQHLPRLDVVTGLELDGVDDARHFRAQIGAALGAQAADRGQLRAPFIEADLHARNGLLRHALGLEALDHIVEVEAPCATNHQDNGDHNGNHDQPRTGAFHSYLRIRVLRS